MSPPAQQAPTPFVSRCAAAGLAACCADLVSHPLELAKIRIQVQGQKFGGSPSPLSTNPVKYHRLGHTLLTIYRAEGAAALYNGLSASMQRQLVYASIRIGGYDTVKKYLVKALQGENADLGAFNVGLRVLAATTTCCFGVAVTQPMDVVKVRMQAMRSGPHIKKRYTGALQGYNAIYRQDGVRGLWTGTVPNMTRNSVVSVAELVTYDVVKEAIIGTRLLSDNLPCHFVSSLCSGFLCTLMSSPADVIRTRVMNSSPDVYRGMLHCATVTLKHEGPMAFYKGFFPYYCRIGTWNIVMFVCYEQIKKLFTYCASNS